MATPRPVDPVQREMRQVLLSDGEFEALQDRTECKKCGHLDVLHNSDSEYGIFCKCEPCTGFDYCDL
jgi:hypothetical protein